MSDYDVAVIGFGPTGALATNLLGQAGLRVLAIDRSTEIFPLPRALAIDHEIFRLFDNIGIAAQVAPHVAPFTASEHFGADGTLIRRIDMVPPPHPQGYTPSMVMTQPLVETALRAQAATWPSVTLELGTELLGLSQDETEVTLGLPDRSVTTAFAIGCDGASSLVRQSLGLPLEDLDFDEPWLVIDVMVTEAAAALLPQNSAQYCEPQRPTSYLIGVGLHRRWEIMLLPDEDPREMVWPERIWQLLSRWITPEDGTLWRAATYRFHALVARTWQSGRVFLAGDAAHQQPPFIGQGMCQGLRDAANLAWRLEHVLRGHAGPALFDSYGQERAAHVRRLTGRIKAIGQVICERDPVRAAARDARIIAEGGGSALTITRQEIVPKLECGLLDDPAQDACGSLFPQPRLADGRLMDEACGTGWRLVEDARSPSTAAVATHPGLPGLRHIAVGPLGLAEAEGVLARWFDRHGCAAALVRPDHYVFGVAATKAGILSLLNRLDTRLSDRLKAIC